MPLPDSLRIGPYLFRRELAPPDEVTQGGRQVDGTCECSRQLITVAAGLSPERQRVVTLHEVLHALWYERGLGASASEERAVEALATALCAAYPDFAP